MNTHSQTKLIPLASLPVAVLLFGTISWSKASECHLQANFSQLDDDGKRAVAVWAGDGKAVLFGESLHVNTDGTKRSYKVEDFWGEKDAVNNLCNAMSDRCAGLSSEGLRGRRILTEKAKASGWHADDLSATKIDPQIIPFGSNAKPCPERDGFLISATALTNPRIGDECDPDRYADSMSVPAIVVPKRPNPSIPSGFEKNNAKVGDLAVIATPDLKRLAFAVIGDTGPKRELGEGTIALARTMLGKDHDPVNYREVRGKPPFVGEGWDVPYVVTLILTGSRNAKEPYMSKDRINHDGMVAFEAWGGAARLKACIAAYRHKT